MKRVAAWSCLVLAILAWTSVSYVSQLDPNLREEILLRHFLVSSAVSFPTSLLLGLLAEHITRPFLEATGLGRAVIVSLVCFLSGYLQWVVCVPGVVRWWKTRRQPLG